MELTNVYLTDKQKNRLMKILSSKIDDCIEDKPKKKKTASINANLVGNHFTGVMEGSRPQLEKMLAGIIENIEKAFDVSYKKENSKKENSKLEKRIDQLEDEVSMKDE